MGDCASCHRLAGRYGLSLGKNGPEFMPPPSEGDLLYVPTTDPGLSGMKAKKPAPLSMIETTIRLKPDNDRA